MLPASDPGEQSELSLLRGSLIGFLYLCKLGYPPPWQISCPLHQGEAISVVPSVAPFSGNLAAAHCPHLPLSPGSHAALQGTNKPGGTD